MTAIILPHGHLWSVLTFYEDGREGPEFYGGPDIGKAFAFVRNRYPAVWFCWVRPDVGERSQLVAP